MIARGQRAVAPPTLAFAPTRQAVPVAGSGLAKRGWGGLGRAETPAALVWRSDVKLPMRSIRLPARRAAAAVSAVARRATRVTSLTRPLPALIAKLVGAAALASAVAIDLRS